MTGSKLARCTTAWPLLLALLFTLTGLPLPAQPPPEPPPPRPRAAEGIADLDLFEKSLEAAFRAQEAYGAYDSPDELRRVLDIGYRLAQETDFDEFPFTFTLLEMPVPNAFALPGGQIFITRGMLDLGLDDDMLAALLGHEIAHVTRHHGTRMQKRATLLNVLSTALLVGVMVGADNDRDERDYDPYSLYGRTSEGNSKVEGVAAASLVIGQLLLSSYSREYEDEADDEGQRLAAAAGFSPDGARRLWQTMLERIPLNKTYGYWRSHPFEDSRMRAADTRAKLLKVQEPTEPEQLRQTTQGTLLSFLGLPRKKRFEPEMVVWVKETALAAWPRGTAAEGLRTEKLQRLRDAQLSKPELARDYGEVIRAYEEQLETVEEISPESPFLARTRDELAQLRKDRDAAYPKAAEVVAGQVYETAFLETFLSSFPEAPEGPEVALALGNAYSRLRQPAEAVEHFLEAWKKAPESDAGKQAREGLRNLTPYLEQLAALQKLADDSDDPELRALADKRLAEIAGTYKDVANGAEYLHRHPTGPYAEKVNARLNTLADNLFTEVVVYQGVGDSLKALERINLILAHAPLSPAAEKLREQAILEG